jgi:hypothetical protein
MFGGYQIGNAAVANLRWLQRYRLSENRMTIGRVALEKLATLAESDLIRYIAPMTSN